MNFQIYKSIDPIGTGSVAKPYYLPQKQEI